MQAKSALTKKPFFFQNWFFLSFDLKFFVAGKLLQRIIYMSISKLNEGGEQITSKEKPCAGVCAIVWCFVRRRSDNFTTDDYGNTPILHACKTHPPDLDWGGLFILATTVYTKNFRGFAPKVGFFCTLDMAKPRLMNYAPILFAIFFSALVGVYCLGVCYPN